MQITVALDGEKKRDLRFFAGDDMSLTIVVYEHDGDTTPITVTNVRFAAADGELPMDSEFVVPSNFFGRVNYRIVGEVEDITTTLAYGVMQTEGGWPSLFCWCSGPGPYGIVGKADNITVLDANQNFDSPTSVEGALRELGDFKKSVGDLSVAVAEAEAAAEDAEAAAIDAAAAADAAAATLAGAVKTVDLAASGGAALVGFEQEGVGAVARTQEEKSREIVSVLDFGADPSGAISSSAAFNAALATGANVFAPDGIYALDAPVQIKFDGQSLYADGTYTTRLRWTANDATKNMVELLSTRRDTGISGAARTCLNFSGFMLESASGSALKNAVWVEDGVFHSRVEELRFLSFNGTIAEAFIKLDSGGGLSSPVNCVFRDITGTGIANGTLTPIPVGLWMESGIECMFERVAFFSVDTGWRLGTSVSANMRRVENCTFIRCHAEIGDRGYGSDTGKSLELFAGTNLNFYACKFTSGINDQAGIADVTNQRCVSFSTSSAAVFGRSVNFNGCQFWQVNPMLGAPVAFDATSDYKEVSFRDCIVDSKTSFISVDPATDVVISGLESTTYVNYGPLLGARFGRRGMTADPGSLAAAAYEVQQIPNWSLPYSIPVLASCSNDLQGLHLSAYKRAVTGEGHFSLWNPINSGVTVDLASSRLSYRIFSEQDVAARRTVKWDPPSLAQNIGSTTTVALPGAQMGDFVAANFGATSTGGLNSSVVHAWVSAAGVVSVRLFNPNTTTRNFANSDLTVFLLRQGFDFYGSSTYDPASLATLTGASTTLTVTGASVGDYVAVSFSNALQDVLMWGYVSAADTVTVRLFNSSAGTVDLASGTLTAGVYKRYSAL